MVCVLLSIPTEIGKEPNICIPLKKEIKVESFLGTATWYGERFHGKKTASGEIYNMHGLTCAVGDRNIPLGSKLKVTNIKTGKSVIVLVNDRMNKRYHPVDYKGNQRIDLSIGAFNKLAPKKQGLIKVKIEKI